MFVKSKLLKSTHAFATRLGGVSVQEHTKELNLAFGRGDDEQIVLENLEIFARKVGFDPKSIVSYHQIHSDIIFEVGCENCGQGYYVREGIPSADGYFTGDKGVTIGVKSADCVPILFEAEKEGAVVAVGAVHAGWRGSVKGIASKCVDSICKKFQVEPENIRVAIGPCIGKCCFEVSEDVFLAVKENQGERAAERYVTKSLVVQGKYYCDLPALNAYILRNIGIPESNIDIIGECTFCNHEKYFSHRYTGGYRGTMLNIICM